MLENSNFCLKYSAARDRLTQNVWFSPIFLSETSDFFRYSVFVSLYLCKSWKEKSNNTRTFTEFDQDKRCEEFSGRILCRVPVLLSSRSWRWCRCFQRQTENVAFVRQRIQQTTLDRIPAQDGKLRHCNSEAEGNARLRIVSAQLPKSTLRLWSELTFFRWFQRTIDWLFSLQINC
jgi:hypothetical protein